MPAIYERSSAKATRLSWTPELLHETKPAAHAGRRPSSWAIVSCCTSNGEDYTLLAATAFATGHHEVAEQAAQEAEKRDADVEELRKLLAEAAGQ